VPFHDGAEPNIISAAFQAPSQSTAARGRGGFSVERRNGALPIGRAIRLSRAMAKLYFHYSAMNAGKTTMLLQAAYNYRERGMRVLMLTAAHDDRAGRGVIASRIGLRVEGETFVGDTDLFALVEADAAHAPLHCVFVDEAQFLDEAQVWQLARVADRLGIPVMAYGLRTDFQGRLFPGSQALLAIADTLREVRTICRCGRKATMVVRLGPDGHVVRQGAQVEIGGEDKYVSLCRRHWEEETGRMPPEDLVGFAGE
jgi:thymidine kinase